jgi:hypothetical protein
MPDTGDRAIRASDQDRERTSAILGRHYADGRLTLEEFKERLDRAYAARTLGELDDLMTDLPRTDFRELPSRSGTNPRLPERRAPGTIQAPLGRHAGLWQFWVGVTIGFFAVWLISGAAGGPWFLWLVVLLGFIMLRRWLLAEERRIRRHQQDKR